MATVFGPSILDESQKKAIREYKYRGGDMSILYKHVLSPMAQYFVDAWTPPTIAPNMITAIGLMFNLTALVLTLIYDPTLTAAPRWLSFVSGWCVVIYQTLDNMDGKQARKIGASSPLGLLFDHGCDAIVSGISAITLGSVFGAGWTATGLFTCWVSSFFTFYMATWEEFYLHEMWLPIVNGASEGIVMVFGACMCSAYYGSGWWQEPSIAIPFFHRSLPKLFPFQILIAQTMGIVMPGIVAQMCKVMYKLYTETGVPTHVRMANFRRALGGLVLVVTFVVSTFLWCFVSKAFADARHGLALYMVTAFVEIATHLMLMHTSSGQVSNGLGRITAWVSLLLPLNSFHGNYTNVYLKCMSYLSISNLVTYFTVTNRGAIAGNDINFALTPLVDEVALVNVLAVVSALYTFVVGYRHVIALADTLDVYIFFLGKPSKDKAAAAAASKKKSRAASAFDSPVPVGTRRSARSRSGARSSPKK